MIDAPFAALRTPIKPIASQRLVTRSCRSPHSRLRISGPAGTVTTSAASSTTVSAGTTQRTTENAPAELPAMNRLGRSTYRPAAATIAAVGHSGDSPSDASTSSSRVSTPESVTRAQAGTGSETGTTSRSGRLIVSDSTDASRHMTPAQTNANV